MDAGPAVIADPDPRPGAQFGQAQIEPRDLELLRIIGDQIGFPSVAVLVVEIIEIMHGDQSERVPVRRLLKLGREQRVLAERENVRAVGTGVGVGLISEAELPIDRQLIDRDRLVDRGDIGLHFGANVGGRIGGVEHRVEIVARHLIGTQMKIEHAELELHPGKIRVVVEDALERADRRLVVAEFGLELGVLESGVEIVGFEQEALEQEVGGDALVRIVHGRGRRWGGNRRRSRSAGRLRRSQRAEGWRRSWTRRAGDLRESGGRRGERRAGDADRRRNRRQIAATSVRLAQANRALAYGRSRYARLRDLIGSIPLPLHQAAPACGFYSLNPISTECNRILDACTGRHLCRAVSSPTSAGPPSLFGVPHNFDPHYGQRRRAAYIQSRSKRR